jgi:Uma2 family endonuclease
MATVAVSPNEPDLAATDQCVIMHNIGWEGYLRVLRARGENGRPKLLYLDGDVQLMSPAYPHEQMADRLSDLVKIAARELRLPHKSVRSTTFRRRKNLGGAEADASFYLQSLERIRGRRQLDLRRDPPPDLVLEAVNTHQAEAAIEVWRHFGVPVLWIADAARVQIRAHQADRQYAESATSLILTTLTAAEIYEWMMRDLDGDDLEWRDSLTTWVRDMLVPRARGGA